MTQRSSARSGGATRTAVRRPFSVALAGIAMAVVMCAFPLLSAHAETVVAPQISQSPAAPTPDPAPVPPEPTQPKVADPAPSKPPVVLPAPVPVQPAPVAPAPAAPAAPAPVTQVTVEPEPSVAPSEAPVASSQATPSDSPTASASPSASSNWNTPIQDGLKATQAASVSNTKGPGSDMFAVIAIMGGVLLVAAGGIAFALWSRHRFTH
jgi:outer membrane biosynthesis protein TonB